VAKRRSLRGADHTSRGVLPSVVCLSVIEEPRRGSLGPIGLSSLEKKKRYNYKDALSNVTVALPLLQDVNHITIQLFFETMSHNVRSFLYV
jgi:hypothetical protein